MNKNSTSKVSGTDWERLDAMTDEETDLSDCPEVTAAMFAQAIVRKGLQPKPMNQQLSGGKVWRHSENK